MVSFLFRTLLLILSLSSVIILFRTWFYYHRHKPIKAAKAVKVKPNDIAANLAASIRYATVPIDETGTPDAQVFRDFHAFLKRTYPLVHQHLKLEKVGGYSLLYIWPGSDPSLDPAQLMAHQDVVSANPQEWTHPPFAGDIADGYVWGRGALDIKNQLIGILEAAEALLKTNFQPERTLYFAFGHDEETGGSQGAKVLGALLKKRNVHLAAIADEGGGIFTGIVPGIKKSAALIGTGEKGYLTLELQVKSPPGHSSAPPRETGIGRLAKALARIESHPRPANIRFAKPLYQSLGPAVPVYLQVAWANVWLFGPLLKRLMDAQDETRAYIRTTTALTVIHAGTEDNTLPAEATADINFRLIPSDRIKDIVAHVRRVVNDSKVTIKPVEGKFNEPIGPSPIDSKAYQGLSHAIARTYDSHPEAPFVMLGGTDCGHYVDVCDHIYRFTPLIMDKSFMGLEHGIDERIPVKEMAKTVQFYAHLMRSWGSATLL